MRFAGRSGCIGSSAAWSLIGTTGADGSVARGPAGMAGNGSLRGG